MSIIETATNIASVIIPRTEEIEKARRLPKDIAKIMAQAGLFRMVVPEYLGGLQCHPATLVSAIEAVAKADASAAWCVMIGSTTGITAAYMERDAAKEIYSNPETITGGVFAPMGRATFEGGNYQLTGHWNWASGSANCDWLLGGGIVMENGKPKMTAGGTADARQFLFPADKAQLSDTWHVTGLSGTGSGDMLVDNINVQEKYAVSLAEDKPVTTGALYAFPVFGLLSIGIAAVSLGNARAAINDLKDLARAKKPQGSNKTIAQRSTSQTQLAQAEAMLQSSRAFLFETVNKAFDTAEEKGIIDLDIRANVRLAATHAVRSCADVTRSMYELAGGSSVFLSSPLQRRMRDAQVATQHMMVSPQTYELVGRVEFEQDTDSTFL